MFFAPPQKIHSGRFCSTFYGVELIKNRQEVNCVVVELAPLRGEKKNQTTPTKQDLGTC